MKKLLNFKSLKMIVLLFDFLMFQASLAIGYLLWVRIPWHGNWQYFDEFSVVLWILPPLAIIVFKAIGLYKPEMGVIGVQEQTLIFKAIWITYFVILAFSFFYREIQFSRLATLYSMFISIILVSFERFFIRQAFIWLHKKGIGLRYAIIYGAGFNGQRLYRWIEQSPQLGLRVLGYLDDFTANLEKKPENIEILGGIDELPKLHKAENVSQLFVAYRGLSEERTVNIIQKCRDEKIQCWVMPSLYRFNVEHVELQNIGGIPLLGFSEQFGRRSYEILKHIMDRFLAFALIVLSLPLTICVGLGVLATLGRPIFFKQIRVGRRGKEFEIYKFRTLKKSYKQQGISPELKASKKGKSSVSRYAAFLRKSGLDEIPQLLNILKGEMSLVGPRPEMPFIVQKYSALERERLVVKPGITGLWQISDDRKRLLIHENMDYDLYYVKNLSFNLDLAIMTKTFFSILRRIIAKD